LQAIELLTDVGNGIRARGDPDTKPKYLVWSQLAPRVSYVCGQQKHFLIES
jgi:hypothetical protein